MFKRGMGRNAWIPEILPVFLLIFFTGLSSCEDEATDIGLELKSVLGRVQPVYVDTLLIHTSVWTMDSVRTDHASKMVVGNVLDPVFGRTTATIATQYRLSRPWIPGNNADVDSVKLFLVVDKYNGNGVTPQRINVYELYRTLRYDTIYYSNFEVGDSISKWPVGSALYTPGDTMITVYLSKTFGRKIIRDTAVLKDQDLFLSHFKGLYLTTDPVSQTGKGGTILLNLLAQENYLALYYHNDLSAQEMYPFYINGYCARVGMYRHDYDAAPPATAIRYLDQEKSDTVCYLQGLCGVYTKITIPGLDRYKDSSIVLNNVRLEIPYHADPFGMVMEQPSLLALRVKLGDSLFVDVIDRQIPEFYDGHYDEDANAYYINFTQQVQDYLTGKNNFRDFYIVADQPSFGMDRLIMNAWHNSRPMRLILLYTEI